MGRLVKEMKIKSLEEVFLYDLPILEPEIFDHFLGITIKEEVRSGMFPPLFTFVVVVVVVVVVVFGTFVNCGTPKYSITFSAIP